ncbi:MAG: pilus assembly protein N-terminal domain-containing protein, partial [Phycisphaerae bacterium]
MRAWPWTALSPGRGRGARLASAVVLCGAAAASAPAQPNTPTASEAGGSISIRQIEAAPGNRVEMLVGRGAIINLSKKATRVDVGDPRVAVVSILSPLQIMVSAKSVGTTNLILWDETEAQTFYDLAVLPDLAMLRSAIEQTAPGSAVQVLPLLGDKIILRGTVPDSDTADRILQLAQTFAAGGSAAGGGQSQGGAGGPAGAMPEARLGGQTSTGGGTAQSATVINHLTVAGEHQVVLRCTVAEVSKSAIRQLGINGWLAGDNIRDVFAINQIGGINPVNIEAPGGQNVIQPGGLAFTTGD